MVARQSLAAAEMVRVNVCVGGVPECRITVGGVGDVAVDKGPERVNDNRFAVADDQIGETARCGSAVLQYGGARTREFLSVVEPCPSVHTLREIACFDSLVSQQAGEEGAGLPACTDGRDGPLTGICWRSPSISPVTCAWRTFVNGTWVAVTDGCSAGGSG